MLQLYSNNQQLDISGVSFNLTRKNPLFLNTLEGDYVYDLRLPLTDNNKKYFIRFLNRLESDIAPPNPFVEIFFNGIKVFDGNYILKNIKNEIGGSIACGSGNFFSLIKDKYLDEIDYGSISFINNPSEAFEYIDSTAWMNYPDCNFVFPYCYAFPHSYLPEGTEGYVDKDKFNIWDPVTESYFPITPSGIRIIVPFLFLRFIIKKLFMETGYTVDDRFFAPNEDLSRLLVFNNYNANIGIPDDEENNKIGYVSTIIKLVLNRHVPHILISDFISDLQNLFNCRFYFNQHIKRVSILNGTSILLDTFYTDLTGKTINQFESEFNNYNGFYHEIKNDEDDMAFTYYYLENNKDFFENNFGGSVNTIQELPNPPLSFILYYVESELKIYFYHSGSWHIAAEWLQFISKIYSGKNRLDILTNVSGLVSEPLWDKLSICGNNAYDYRKLKLKLVFWHGIRLWPLIDNHYPVASSIRNDYRIQHPSIYNKFWNKYFAFMMNTRCVNLKINLSVSDITKLDLSKKIRVNGINYLIKEVKTPISERSIGVSTLECYRV